MATKSLLDANPISPSAGGIAVPISRPRGSVLSTVLLAATIAFGMSLQFLAQLFVWRNWPVSEVLEGWVYVLRDRLIVALCIAFAILLLGVTRSSPLRMRAALLAASVLLGALIGERVVQLLYGGHDSVAAWLTHALRWSVVSLAVTAAYYLWRNSADSREQLRREDLRRQSVEQQLTNTRLTALRKQIEPHFLFNTLATVRRLHQTEPENGANMLANFIDYLARLLPMLERSEVQLGDEADLVYAYLSVIQIRMSERLKVSLDVPTALRAALVPPLSIATLVENAIKHGIAPLTHGGAIEITAANNAGKLEISVSDNGVGFKTSSSGGSGIGLYNVRSRLATLHGPAASLEVFANPTVGVCARIALPVAFERA
jgi:two-component sensor histidine kinase